MSKGCYREGGRGWTGNNCPKLVGWEENKGDPRMGDYVPIVEDEPKRKVDPLNFDNPTPKSLRFNTPTDPDLDFGDTPDPCGKMGFWERLFS
jgi:hypothetical protein